ncbi:hypothetical protein P3T76_015940 [Phytophthora citrophthora]|uniref:Apple domain-containing protein n=1 Tax=Phytophthora citrophthora TaxID=4793 RepID=A0AAD9FYE5_9STRA|nr:hypothetical protein P3T76_015940 [Phytophthora citrophthora]
MRSPRCIAFRKSSSVMRLTTLLLVSITTSLAVAIPEECIVEDGFDYVGNDLFSLMAVNAFECCHQCQQFAAAGCRAYSWTEDGGGSCWLKNGRGTVTVKANVKSGIISAFRFAETCILEHGIDYEGYDIANMKASEAGDCCSICEAIPGCRAFTFTNHSGGTCWLKNAKGNMVLNPNVISSISYVEEPTCGIEQGVDYVGMILEVHVLRMQTSAVHFVKLLEAVVHSPGGGTCFFKNRKDQVSWEEGIFSGQILANPVAPSCALELNTEYTGNNIGNISSLNPYGCCSICMKTAGCGAFSWAEGICYLKSKREGVRPSDHTNIIKYPSNHFYFSSKPLAFETCLRMQVRIDKGKKAHKSQYPLERPYLFALSP